MIEDVAAFVLNDPDIGGQDATVMLDDGALIGPVQAKFTDLAESVDQLKSAFARSGLNCWIAVSDLPSYRKAQFVMSTFGCCTHRVLDREVVAGSVRFQLVESPSMFPDFSPLDFSSEDFNTGE